MTPRTSTPVRLDPIDDKRIGWTQDRLNHEIELLETNERTGLYGPDKIGTERRAEWHAQRAVRVTRLFDAVLPAKPKPRPKKAQAVARRANGNVFVETKRRGRRGHPTRKTRALKRASWFRPDVDEEGIRETSRRVREAINKNKHRGEGYIGGLLEVAAQDFADAIVEVLPELDTPTDRELLWRYYKGVAGAVALRFRPELPPSEFLGTLPSFNDWRTDA